jgi:hypothetical protein
MPIVSMLRNIRTKIAISNLQEESDGVSPTAQAEHTWHRQLKTSGSYGVDYEGCHL